MKSANVTIKDIANELNISISTVSRGLADNPVVKPETRAAIQALAKKYNYTPNFTALSLKSQKTKTIGIIIPQLVHEFFASVIRGIEDHAYTNGFSVIICSSHNSYEREVIDSKTLITGRVDGLLACISRETRTYEHFAEFVDRNIPLVFFDCTCPEVNSPKVVIDDFEAGFQATKHLIDMGCKKIAFLGGPSTLTTNIDRLNGYKKALSGSDLLTNSDLIINNLGDDDFEEGKELGKTLISGQSIDGIFATTDMLAIGAMKSIKEKGLKIPDDIAIIGFSNWAISKIYEPSLSTVSQPGYEMGLTAAELLLDNITNPKSRNNETHVLNTEVVIRESTKRKP